MKTAMVALMALSVGIFAFVIINGPGETYEQRFNKLLVDAQHQECGPEFTPSYGQSEPVGLAACNEAVYKREYLKFYGVEPTEQQ